MAGDWIKVKTDLATDPAVISVAADLGLDEDLVVGKLCRLWSWANTHTSNGHAAGVTGKWLDKFLECDNFATALAAVHWLEVTPDGLEIPRFERHNGKSAKTRVSARERKQRSRSRHAAGVTLAGHTSDREEKRKRREEVIEPPAGVSLSRTSGTTTAGRTEFGFPTANGGTWYLSTIKYEQYGDTYADLDLDFQLQKARQWLRDNKQRRKTPGGMTAFLTKWLNRCTDAAGPGGDRGTNRKVGSGL